MLSTDGTINQLNVQNSQEMTQSMTLRTLVMLGGLPQQGSHYLGCSKFKLDSEAPIESVYAPSAFRC